MELNVHNIARVKDAKIEINSITVVAGENSSGKSTISKALYSILDGYNDGIAQIIIQKRKSKRKVVSDFLRSKIDFRVNTAGLVRVIINIERILNTTSSKEGVVVKIRNLFDKNNLIDFFTIQDIEQLYNSYNEVEERKIDFYFDYVSQTILDGIFGKQINCLKNQSKGYIQIIDENRKQTIEVQNNKVQNLSENNYIEMKYKPIYISTSDLIDMVGTYKKLYSAQKSDSISYANLKLTQLLMNEIDKNNLVAEEYHKIEEQKSILNDIYQQVLDGEIHLENKELVYWDNWCKANIELTNVASGMKIFLLLQRLINNGTFLQPVCLIIDEPESNQHPRWQLVLAKLLVLLSKRLDVKVYLNSHSPYFVRAIEYYAHEYKMLDDCRFYTMLPDGELGLYSSKDVTNQLGIIYDKLAEPFNEIM